MVNGLAVSGCHQGDATPVSMVTFESDSSKRELLHLVFESNATVRGSNVDQLISARLQPIRVVYDAVRCRGLR